MNIFEKVAIFLFRLLGCWLILTGLQSLVWYEMWHFGLWTKQDYSAGWAISAGINLIGGVILFIFSGRLGSMLAGDLR